MTSKISSALDHGQGFPVTYPKTGLLTGLIVTFEANTTRRWQAIFANGLTQTNLVRDFKNSTKVLVVANGASYVFNTASREVICEGLCNVSESFLISEDLIIVRNTCEYQALSKRGILWKSRRIALDGFRSEVISETTITGEAWAAWADPEWQSFALDIKDGTHTGGPSFDPVNG